MSSHDQHRKRRKAYGKKKKNSQVHNGCPTPLKTAFQSPESAIYSINRGGNAGQGWGTYQCICGWWHVTSTPGRLIREFDPTFYRSEDYVHVPYNATTYRDDKRAWNARKG